ncbi:MAG: undecaprenyl/decaprenyl-phosphate alpha-N-acetylglucosaminyl 1-phosphate transferase [Actinomycetota bacterium]|nr:undecaprenyl/decaprenyl-phosphate alpha-N-acetylglucosaminyl 1-phosphate transferase [Actinomycetota bacterium]
MVGYGAVLVVAALSTYVFAFGVRRVAVRVGAVVLPDERKVHASPTPTVGGAAMFFAFLLAMWVASQIPQFEPVFTGSSEPLGVVLAACVIFVLGLADDFWEVSAPAKLAGQVLAGSVLYFLGVTMFYFRVPFADFIVLSPDLAPLATVLWVVAIANAVNLIDGLDGLAAGIVAIAAAAFFVYGDRLFDAGLLGGENVGPLVAVVACGICLGFLPHNFHPARIFMGDSGAMLLGLLMAASTMVVGGRTADQFSGQTYFFFAPMFIPLIVLGVPILDTAFAIVRRTVRRAGVSTPDKEHLHHRLMRLGHGHRRSVVILWAWTAILSGLVLFPTFTNEGNAVIPFAVAGLGVVLYTLFSPGARRRGEAQVEAATGDVVEAPTNVVALAERRRSAGGSS